MNEPSRVLTESEAPPESFHDCHVHGIRWRRDQFLFALDLQYILEWIQPTTAGGAYRFRICEATLVFRDASDVVVDMDWTRSALDAAISSMSIHATRTTPNGRSQRKFEIAFSAPEGTISLWSTVYEVGLKGEPVLASLPMIQTPSLS